MSSFFRSSLAAIAVLALFPLGSHAQEPDPSAQATVRVGPLALKPTLALSNAGVDTNIFNETEPEHPKSDWTFTVGPQSDFWLRLGRARLSGRAGGSYDWFATYGSQRSLGTSDRVRLELPLAHIRPYAGAGYLSTRERPGFEIDLRARRTERVFNGGVGFPISKRTIFTVGWQKTVTRFAAGTSFEGTWLRDVLNRRLTAVTATMRYKLTPLTTITLEGESARERFQFSSERDANSVRVVPGVEFDTFALINGTAKVGYRRLKMLTPGVPDYTGPVASVDLGYTLLGVTRFSVAVSRDVNYSYSLEEPYYVLTGTTVSLTQAVGGPWALTARAGIQRLGYRRAVLTPDANAAFLPGAVTAAGQGSSVAEPRLDIVRLYGGGLSYKLGPNTRLGFNADYYTRRSDYDYRDFRGLRAGTSVTYGF